MIPSKDCIKLADCKARRLYKLRCRNLNIGIFNPATLGYGFLGIRRKCGDTFLSTEFHHESGPPFGTVYGVTDTGIDVPEFLSIVARFPGSWDLHTGLEVKFDKPVVDGGKGWYFTGTGLPGNKILPCSHGNTELLTWLLAKEAELFPVEDADHI